MRNLRFKGSYNFAIENTSDVCVALFSCHIILSCRDIMNDFNL